MIICRGDSDFGKVYPSGVRIGKNSYGLGVFAFAFIQKGTAIARVSGQVIHDPNYGSDYCIDAGDSKVLEPAPPFCYLNHACEPNCQLTHYVREEDAEESLEAGGLTEEEMNFEGDGNLKYSDLADDDGIYGGEEEKDFDFSIEGDVWEGEEPFFEDDADAEIWIEAIQDIMPNEELTIDYSWPADRAVKCLCGKPKCRGWIVDPAERKLLPR